MIKNGTFPTKKDHRDYSLLKTRKFGAVPATLPDSYSASNTLWIPDQETGSTLFTPPLAPEPYGCTNFSQCQLCINEDGRLYNPAYLESITHANARGGYGVRESLKTVVKYGVQDQQGTIHTNHPAFFNIQPSGAIDAFDAVRLAMFSASVEKRGVSVGSPYWLQWGAVGPNGILPPPDYDLQFASWHNWVCEGWNTIDGVTYLRCQMLQGANYGKGGIVFMPREQFNATMAVNGSIMFTLDKLMPGEQVQTVDMNIVQMIVSFIRQLFHL